jgi:hypothetical protein
MTAPEKLRWAQISLDTTPPRKLKSRRYDFADQTLRRQPMNQGTTRQLARPLLGIALLFLTAVAAQAQQSNENVIRINGGSMVVGLHTNPQHTQPSAADPASLVKIYSDLGTGSNVYLPNIGWSVSGPNSGGGQVATATPFTPKRNYNLALLKVAVLAVSGTNGVTISLDRDNNGAPGTAIRTWNLANLPTFPGCCKLDLARLKKTVKVKKGVQYWVVATTGKATQDSSDSWNMNPLSIFGTVAQQFNNGAWQVTKNSALLPAFSVLGTPAH